MTVDGAVPLRRDVVVATGPDSLTFLQGQISQDIQALSVGDSAFSLLLQPQGKIDAFLRVTRTGEDELALDVDAGWGDAVAARLDRFKLRTRCDLLRVDWPCLAVRGDRWADAAPPAGQCWRVTAETPGVPGYDLLGPDARVPDGVPAADPAAYEALRIVAGVPRMGSELDASTIPAATGVVDRAVSFTKGCYTGQELVARIDSRGGNVPRRLRLVRLGDVAPPADADVVVGTEVVGRVTSVARLPGVEAHVALAYVARAVEPPTDAVVRWDRGETPAHVVALPG